jgi:hypothetical protein
MIVSLQEWMKLGQRKILGRSDSIGSSGITTEREMVFNSKISALFGKVDMDLE